jgi:hypothetical protein
MTKTLILPDWMLDPFFKRNTGHERNRAKIQVEAMAKVSAALRAEGFRATPCNYQRLGFLHSSRDYAQICGREIGGNFSAITFEKAIVLTSF